MDEKVLLTTHNLWALAAGIVLVALIYLSARAARGKPVALPARFLAEIGLDKVPAPLLWLVGGVWTALLVAFLGGLVWLLLTFLLEGPPEAGKEAIDDRWYIWTLSGLTLALGAVIALPFTLLRTAFAARQTRTAEENLTTDLINKAVEGLGAQKEVSQIGRVIVIDDEEPDGGKRTEVEWRKTPYEPRVGEMIVEEREWQVLTTTEPNLEVRVGAILSLERIARERAKTGTEDGGADHIRIMEILCAYIRENAPASDCKDHPFGAWPAYPEDPTPEVLEERPGKLLERMEKLRGWTDEFPKPRVDIQAALEVIGRRTPQQITLERATPVRGSDDGYRLDLRETNLRRGDLSKLNFGHARFEAARMEGVDLGNAKIDGARLKDARMEGANLREARLEAAFLDRARLEGATLTEARMERAYLRGARLEGAGLDEAWMGGTHLAEARMEGANLAGSRMARAELSGARIEGAYLREAQMDAAYFERARMDENTSLNEALVRHAAVQATALPAGVFDLEQISTMFGDGSVRLPEHLKSHRPRHWPEAELGFKFDREWERWKREGDAYRTPEQRGEG